MGYVLPSCSLFSVQIASSLSRNARITSSFTDDLSSKIALQYAKANLQNPPKRLQFINFYVKHLPICSFFYNFVVVSNSTCTNLIIFNFMRETILVTGRVGFIGTNLCLRLLKEGKETICLDNLSTGSPWNLKLLKQFPNFTFIYQDITIEETITY